MPTLEQQADRAAEIARDRDWEAHHGGEGQTEYRELDLETFKDAPYAFICPDGPTVEKQEALLCELYGALEFALEHQESTNHCGMERTETRSIGLSYRLAKLGLAVLNIAESRGVEYRNGKMVVEA